MAFRRILIALVILCSLNVHCFQFSSGKRPLTLKKPLIRLRMSDFERPPKGTKQSDPLADDAETTPPNSIMDEDDKPMISNSMRERLLREAQSQGADPNFNAGNPILVISAVIAVLVIVGGQGIFY